MHAIGEMARGQPRKAKHLRPCAVSRLALEKDWCDTAVCPEDELSLAAPSLLASISRRAFHGRARTFRLNPDEILERPFGDVLMQVLMGDFFQLNPVANHTLLESLCTSPVPGVPRKTTEEDHAEYALLR